ncbi:hypothetical protein NA57DRAFT_69659 [Rhizodiscina lignyota]|uniref:Filamentation protein n=1 Tax=Rhizodiscina lignyota TaxID=1504668 RepID=A0A9P4I5P8_9PEZI|nr:hypothetical protein NA57DRAFT_69659 [Rhizodiscina lignyota]
MAGQLSEKAIRYLAQLDAARCDGRWNEVPELARKVEKHAPQRKCLAITARTEAQIAVQGPQRPVTALSDSSKTKSLLSPLLAPLQAAFEQSNVLSEDAFEATVCLAWIQWLLGEPQLAVAQLPDDFAVLLKELLEGDRTIGQSVRVCAIKGAYIKGHSLEKLRAVQSATSTYLSMLPYLSSFQSFKTTNSQFCLWTQCLLTRLCVISASPTVPVTGIDINTTLWLFSIWQTFWTTSTALRSISGYDPRKDLGYLWRDVWFAYYRTLSDILQRESPEILSEDEFLASRLRQRADLKNIEAINESFLLKETTFPKATERNEDVEAWADAVMRNWRVMCGPTWTDEELGAGGKGAVGRGVLDILYRAATKTYHSTQILRHLFTVHASLAEFDLAFKAFDSYVEIVTRGKDDAEKSGEADRALDDDDTVLKTSAEAIRILCRFGGRKEAEKAIEIGDRMEKWLKQHTPVVPTTRSSREDQEDRTEMAVSPKAISIAYRAIALSQAHWARVTYDAKARAGLQTQAVHCFTKSLDPKFEDPRNVETVYSLSLLLAETRDISGAIKLIKQALERRAVPIWHLLALLLTARSEYTTAGRACDAAFEQFRDPSNLYGAEESERYKSDHLNQLSATSMNEKAGHRRTTGIVDRMEAFERESLLQVKITQLSLIEAIDGSTAAVDSSDQLLALYARLFGDPSSAPLNLQPTASFLSPPKTARSLRDSILGRSSNSKRISLRPKSGIAGSTATGISRPSTMATHATAPAPTIQVIDEEGQNMQDEQKHSHHHVLHHKPHSERPVSRRSESVRLRRRRSQDLEKQEPRPATSNGVNEKAPLVEDPPPVPPIQSATHNAEDVEYHAISSDEERPATRNFPPIAHNLPLEKEPPPAGQHNQPPHQDVRLPAPFPTSPDTSDYAALEPKLPVLQERRHKVSLLVQVWLFIAGLYTRAAMYEDAKGAIDEAFKLVQGFEGEVSKQDPSVRGFSDRGWGGGKSVEGLWGDVWAEQGHLARARELPHEAMAYYEKALSRFPDHPAATVGLSEILLDIYCQKIPPEPADPASLLPSTFSTPDKDTASAQMPSNGDLAGNANSTQYHSTPREHHADGATGTSQSQIKPITPEELNRLAARDRAYSLLSSLTKLGCGWDYSEAWFALARAYEEGGQVEKAKEVLWWCVELEDTRPIRSWGAIGLGGGVL